MITLDRNGNTEGGGGVTKGHKKDVAVVAAGEYPRVDAAQGPSHPLPALQTSRQHQDHRQNDVRTWTPASMAV